MLRGRGFALSLLTPARSAAGIAPNITILSLVRAFCASSTITRGRRSRSTLARLCGKPCGNVDLYSAGMNSKCEK